MNIILWNITIEFLLVQTVSSTLWLWIRSE